MSGKVSGYKKKIIRQLYFSHGLSCAHLSTAIKKSLPLTTRIINELIADGSVIEVGHAVSTGGRRPIVYSLKQDLQYIVSVAMDQYITRIAMMDMGNNFIKEIEKFELK